MKKLILIFVLAVLGTFSYAQQTPASQPVRFQIHKEKCVLRHEGNGIRHDFRKFHRYKHFKHRMHKLRKHRMMKRAVR